MAGARLYPITNALLFVRQNLELRMSSAVTASLDRLPQRRSRRRRATDQRGRRLPLIALSLAIPFLLLPLTAAAVYLGAARYFAPAVGVTVANAEEPAQRREAYRLASIVFVPWTGVETCEMRRFDNATGQISYDGTAACDFPPPAENKNQDLRLHLSGEKPVTAAERMRAIHEAFKK